MGVGAVRDGRRRILVFSRSASSAHVAWCISRMISTIFARMPDLPDLPDLAGLPDLPDPPDLPALHRACSSFSQAPPRPASGSLRGELIACGWAEPQAEALPGRCRSVMG